ncbi:MAG: PKD domain-containing protein [Flavobacteriia bacterium]
MKKIFILLLTICFQHVVFAQSHLQKPQNEKTVNDTIVFDINQAVFTNVAGINYMEFPVILKSTNTGITSFDFWFQFNLNKLTYVSTSSLISGLDAFSNYNSANLYLSNTSSGTSITFIIPANVPVIKLKFQLATACTQITEADFSNVTTLFDGDVSSHKFEAPTQQPIQLLSANPLCTHNDIVFTYPSTFNGSVISTYAWDFGNGDQGTSQTDSSQFSEGAHTVNLTVTTVDGCTNTITKEITVIEGPNAAFSAVYNAGLNAQVFTDESTILTGNINQYEWNYGDASPNEFIQNATHSYQVAGSYLVTLTVTSDNGCSNSYDSIVSSSDGIFEFDFFTMSLSPNPSMNNCQIVSDKFFSGTMTIENTNGAVILEKKIQGTQFNVDLATYSNGTYLVKLSNNSGKKLFKVIKL